MREVIRGVIDVLRTSGANRREAQAAEDGEAFQLPEQADETRDDTAYAADDTRDSAQAAGRGGEEHKGRNARRAQAAQDGGRARGQVTDPTAQREETARLMRGVDRLAATGLDQQAMEGEDAVTLSAEALTRAQDVDDSDTSEADMTRGQMTGDRMTASSSEDADEQQLRQVLNRGETARRMGDPREQSGRTTRQEVAQEAARVATSAVQQRAGTEQVTDAHLALGQQGQGDDDLVDEAAAQAFDEAQATRDGEGASPTTHIEGGATSAQMVAQLASGPSSSPAADQPTMGPLGESAAPDTMMEEVIKAQRGAAGGDRVGDSDAVIRVAQGAAGALEVKVKREGNDLSLRVRAEDLAMRHVMVDSLPELKQELQKANLVEGQIEVQEDGIEDQMQSDFTWDGQHSAKQDADGESRQDGRASAESGHSETRTKVAGQHDGQLHVVA